MSDELVYAVLTHTKTRNMYGLVIINCDIENKLVQVKYAKQWSREKLNQIPNDVHSMYTKLHWTGLYIDQITGQHIIESIRHLGVSVKILTTQKDLKDPTGIEDLEVMDKNEMVALFIKFRQNKQIEFHSKPSRTLEILEEQMPLFLEHITEAGSVDYYAPGDEHDHLTKALLMCCFAVRKILERGAYSKPVCGPLFGNRKYKPSRAPDLPRQPCL